MPNIALSTRVEAPPELAFDLSRSIDTHAASMSRSAERAVAGVTEGHIRLGEEVTWQARHFGIEFRMTSRITEMDPPGRFVDEQVTGPFESWRHVHLFEGEANGTRMMDRIDYETPFGVGGRAIDRLFLANYLTRLILQRNDYIKRLAESN